VHLLEACAVPKFLAQEPRASDVAHRKDYCFYRAQYAKIFPQVFLTSRVGRQPPQTPPKFFRHITLFLGNTLLDIFKRQLIATSVPHRCQKCGNKSAELGKLSQVLGIVDNSMQ
jgi:hypothetical protein